MPDLQEATTRAVSTAQVELSALVNPIGEWVEVFAAAFINAENLGSQIVADPAPILAAIANNQGIGASFLAGFGESFVTGYLDALGGVPASIQAALDQIQQGNIQQGFGDLILGALIVPFLAPLITGDFLLLKLPDIGLVLSNPFENISNVINTGLSIGTLFNLLPLLTDTLAPVLQLGVTAQDIYDGIEAGDYEAAANAIISFPSEMANTILNGASSSYIANGGLLGPTGIIQAALNLRAIVAGALTPPPVTPLAMQLSGPEVNALDETFTPNEAGDTGVQGGQLLSLAAGPEGKVGQQDPPTTLANGTLETNKDLDVDKVTNTGVVLPFLNRSGTSSAGSNGAAANKPGERLRAAFEGTADRIEKGFNDTVKGFDNAIKGLGNRDKKDDGAGAAGEDAGAGAGAGAAAAS